ncbi:MAG: acyltransferase domain-containing protein, partial [Proteobacteria bacterium]|nr:acyltransferase domain-containing protein [Pseudomonadota bacterium]
SKEADGTVLGECIGLFVLKRLEDAERDNNKIYAVIRGMGSSSDGKSQSIYAPRAEGQLKALQTAYNEAGIDPATVGLVEAHGTGTRVGDVVEFQALNRLFGKTDGNRRRCALGSVKSMIGHTKAAAGAAGLMKAVLALYHKVLPPTLKVDEPDPKLNIHDSPFYLNTTTRPWFSNKNHPRRSGVSAFGFGGSNFHVVLEEYHRDKQKIAWDGSVEIAAFSASTPQVLTERFHSFKMTANNGASFQEVSMQAAKTRNDFCSSDPYRLLIVLERSMDLPQLFDRTSHALTSQGTSNPWHEKNIYYGNLEPPGKIAFVFPGQGSQYISMGRDLVCSFPVAFNVLEDANKKYENIGCLTDFIYPPPALTAEEKKSQQDNLQKTDIAQPAIGAVSIAMQQILQGLGVHPDATCGHSFGELSALCAAGWIDLDTFLNLSIERGRLMATVSRNSGAMLAVKAPLEKLADLIKASKIDVVLANKNSPQQGVLSGSIAAISLAEKMCKQKGFKTIRLPVSSAFHSSLVKDAQEPFKQALKTIVINPSGIPVFSNTTGSPYPDSPDDAKELLGEHLLCPVDFVSEIENLFSAGVRTYIEVGPKSVLTGLVKSILENRNHESFALDDSGGKRLGVADLARTLSRIAALGHGVDLSCWEETRPPLRKQRMRIPIAGVNYRSQRPSDSQSDRPKAVSA